MEGGTHTKEECPACGKEKVNREGWAAERSHDGHSSGPPTHVQPAGGVTGDLVRQVLRDVLPEVLHVGVWAVTREGGGFPSNIPCYHHTLLDPRSLKLQRRTLTEKPVVPRRLYWGLNWGRLQEARVVRLLRCRGAGCGRLRHQRSGQGLMWRT